MADFDPQAISLSVVMNDNGSPRCVYLNNMRIVGSKPYVSEGLNQRDWQFQLADLQRAFVSDLAVTLGPRPIADAPKNGTLLILWIAPDDREHALEDTEGLSPTIGFNNYEDDGVDEWKFAGWCWSHDHFTAGKGTPVAFQPFPFASKFPAEALSWGEQ